ncbi:MAG TPA: sugar ABC transporter ATP-binding protein, partial [Acetobacteraceae bacterium]|nr:sugar ABC transporter ATP-binding protein [Acetobacteraceae bacterium]
WAPPAVMSGGTQQKLLIARWLGLRPQLLVLEEPTRGVDIGTKREIYALIRGMAAQGSAVIWWSTEHAELISLCEIVVAFDAHGNPTGVLAANELSDERLGAATGMAA